MFVLSESCTNQPTDVLDSTQVNDKTLPLKNASRLAFCPTMACTGSTRYWLDTRRESASTTMEFSLIFHCVLRD